MDFKKFAAAGLGGSLITLLGGRLLDALKERKLAKTMRRKLYGEMVRMYSELIQVLKNIEETPILAESYLDNFGQFYKAAYFEHARTQIEIFTNLPDHRAISAAYDNVRRVPMEESNMRLTYARLVVGQWEQTILNGQLDRSLVMKVAQKGIKTMLAVVVRGDRESILDVSKES
jgi:hypothetical protein